mgnify:CR=1 FL=1
MEDLSVFGRVNWIAVVLGGVFSMILGFLWYGPLFGKLWLRTIGSTLIGQAIDTLAFIAIASLTSPPGRMTPATLPEVLRERYRIGRGVAEESPQVVDAQRGRAEPGHQRVPRRRADGLVAERALEQHAPRGKPVDVRRLDHRHAVAAEQGLEIVHADQQDVRLVGGLDCSRPRQQGEQREHRVFHVAS